MREKRAARIRGWRKSLWLLVSIAVLAAAVLVLFPSALLDQQAAARLTEYLVSRLGPDAICAEVEIGWRSVRLRDIVLPLDTHGSQLSISSISADIDPLVLVSQPAEFERILRNVAVTRPTLMLSVSRDTAAKNERSDWTPKAFDLLARLDSLQGFTFEHGRFSVVTGDSLVNVLTDVRGAITQEVPGKLVMHARGNGDYPVRSSTRIEGVLFPLLQQVELSARVEIGEGTVQILGLPLDEISSNGGILNARLLVSGDSIEYSGSGALENVQITKSDRHFYVPGLSVSLAHGVVVVDTFRLIGEGIGSEISGSVNIEDTPPAMRADLSADVQLEQFVKEYAPSVPLTGTAFLEAVFAGPISAPEVQASVTSDSASYAGQVAREIRGDLRFQKDSLFVSLRHLSSKYGKASAEGFVFLGDKAFVEAAASMELVELPGLMGARNGVRSVDLSASGFLSEPAFGWTARDSLGNLLGFGSVAAKDSSFDIRFANARGGAGFAFLTLGEDAVSADVHDLHNVAPIFFPASDSVLQSVRSFELLFAGNESNGTLTVSIESDSTARSPIADVVSLLAFNGSYARSADSTMVLNGSWQGRAGQEEFFGRGVVTQRNGRIGIQDLYIDEAGLLTGYVNLESRELDIQLSIDDLPLSKMPIVARAADAWKLGGVLSGEVTAFGSLDSIQWYTDLSLVNGTAQNLPGYWSLLTAQGTSDRMDTLHFTFGRGVRSILEAEGRIDVSEDFVDIRANFPTSDCSDFLQALTGRSGLVRGELEGDLLVSGSLRAPEVLASLRVLNGELFNEITFDRLAVDATLSNESDGSRLLAIPQFAFQKSDEYRFYAELVTAPVKGGRFQAILEGQGDFLDLLQQVDADFTSYGSSSSLRIELGGTWDLPVFNGGHLEITQGKFTYPPAAPGMLDFAAQVDLNTQGVVQYGFIQVLEGPDSLRLDFLPAGSDETQGMMPLIIPSPRIDLGVLRISTSSNGVPVRLPGFMKPEWLCRLSAGTGERDAFTISAYDSTRLHIAGDAFIEDGRFSFPFLSYGGGTMRPVTKWLVDRLYEADWALTLAIGKGLHYDVEVTGFKDSDLFARMGSNPLLGTVAEYLDHISVDAIVTPTEVPLTMEGALVDSSLRLVGELGATSGNADYLDQTFWIESLQSNFDETDIFPLISGRAATYGEDSLGRTVTVHLTIYEIDPLTQQRVPYGRFEDITYVLEADGYTDQEEVLALLGYDFTNLSQGKAEQLLTRTALSAAKRIWLDPISRRLERATFFDQVSLTPGGGPSASLFRAQRENVLTDTLESQGVVRLLKGSHVTVGKYLYSDVFVTYTGELSEASGESERGRLGLIHYWNLQYRVVPLSPDFVLDFAVEYDEASKRSDESVALKYSFTLEP
ncbi:MAG: hypothetical protein H6506_05040 [Calditrichaeota bacterium]|nr:hypothetical protein [Calditrichota bacterium]MCB9366369.1 hypothetical protein [Calditrichota bacterium]MCB9392001.1 hypothetical protein [Calditrichota bacterium]